MKLSVKRSMDFHTYTTMRDWTRRVHPCPCEGNCGRKGSSMLSESIESVLTNIVCVNSLEYAVDFDRKPTAEP